MDTGCTDNKMWGGIEAWGDPNIPSHQSTHAFVHIKGGAIIEHALDGVLTYNSGILDGTGVKKKSGRNGYRYRFVIH